jgi:WD40 repeat protein
MNHSLLQLQWQGSLQDYVTALACSPIDQIWAAASAAGEVVQWQANRLQTYRTADHQSIDCLAYSADGQWLAAGGQGGLWLWPQGELQSISSLLGSWVEQLAWHPTRNLLAIGSGRRLQIWDGAMGEMVFSLELPNSIFDLAWHPQGQSLATAGYRGVTVRLLEDWDTAEVMFVDTGAHRLAWSGDGEYLAAATLDRQLTIARTAALDEPWLMKGFPNKIQQLVWIADQPLLAVVSGGQVVWWLFAEDQWQALAEDETAHSTTVLAANPQVPLIAKAEINGAIVLQDLDFVILECQENAIKNCSLLAWQSQGHQLIGGSQSGILRLWNLGI